MSHSCQHIVKGLPTPQVPALDGISSSPGVWPGSVPGGGDAEINGIAVPSRAAHSDGQDSREDKLLEAIYPNPVVSDTGE